MHHPQRCRGYTQGDYVACQQVESHKVAPLDCYTHWIGAGECQHCGQNHGGSSYGNSSAAARYQPRRNMGLVQGVGHPEQDPIASDPSGRLAPDAEGQKSISDRALGRGTRGSRGYEDPAIGATRIIDFRLKWPSGDWVASHRRYEYADKPKTYRYLLPEAKYLGLRGMDSRDLPLYGSEHIPTFNKAFAIVVTEGEPAAQWLLDHNIQAVGIASGAVNPPHAHVFECLREFSLILWPDADLPDKKTGKLDGLALMAAVVPILRVQGNAVWQLDITGFEQIKDGFDAADWIGTDAELVDFLRSAREPAAPLVESDAAAAVTEAERHIDARHVHRKIMRDQLSDTLEATNVEHLIERAAKIAVCMERWMPALCRSCGARPALIVTCHENLCPLCFQRRFLNDWMVRVEEDPRLKDIRWRLVRFLPKEAVQGDKALKTLRNRFTEQRKRDRIQAGIIGNRCSREHGGIILLALPMECAVPETMGSFVAELVREDVGEHELSSWLLAEYEDEIREAIEAGEQGDTQYVIDWEASTRGRKRFSAFGKLYRTPGCEPEDLGLQPGVSEGVVAIPLVGFTGGNGHAGTHEKRKCPACGSDRLSTERPYVKEDRVGYSKGYAEVLPPPS